MKELDTVVSLDSAKDNFFKDFHSSLSKVVCVISSNKDALSVAVCPFLSTGPQCLNVL